jgi:peptidoglycan/xylan/chitin deacetylase (PgdA/CDA1 family)
LPTSESDGLTRRRFLVRAGRTTIALGAMVLTGALPALATARRLPTPISHGSRATRRIALTVDDGWGPENVRRVFDLLEAEGVAATFMPYAQAMTLDPPLWHRIAAAGYPLANHTNSHPFLTRLSSSKQHFELTNARERAEQITGHAMLPIFRPPFGDYDSTTLAVALDAGYPTVVLWDSTDLDTTGTRSTAAMTAAAERATNGSILLVHGGPDLTPVILPGVIAHYRARGFTFVTLPVLLGLEPGPKPTPAATPPARTPAASPSTVTSSPASPRPASVPPPTAPIARRPDASQSPTAPAAGAIVPSDAPSSAPGSPTPGTPTSGSDPALAVGLAALATVSGAAMAAIAVRRRRTSAGDPGENRS